MPRGFMDDLEGEVIGEEVHEGGFENRLPTGTWVRIPHPPPEKSTHLSTKTMCAFFNEIRLRRVKYGSAM